MIRRLRAAGLTLVEILMGVVVLSILLAVAAPSMSDLMDRRRVIATASEVAGILTYAKAETNSTNSLMYVRFDPDTSANNPKVSCAAVITVEGTYGDCQCFKSAATICQGSSAKMLRLFQLPVTNNVTFAAAATTWGGPKNQIKFTREQSTIATKDFHVDVTGKKAKLRVEVNVVGRVRTCSPDGDMSGYVKC